MKQKIFAILKRIATTLRIKSFGIFGMSLEKGVNFIGAFHISMLILMVLRLSIFLASGFILSNDWWKLCEFLIDILLVWGPKSFVFYKLLNDRDSLKMREIYFKVNLATCFKLIMRYIVLMVRTIWNSDETTTVKYLGEVSILAVALFLAAGLLFILGMVFWFQVVILSYYLELADP